MRVVVLVPATSVLVGPLHAQNRLAPVRTVSRIGSTHEELLVVDALLVIKGPVCFVASIVPSSVVILWIGRQRERSLERLDKHRASLLSLHRFAQCCPLIKPQI